MLGEFYEMQVGDFLRCLRVECMCQFPIRKCLISIDFRFERSDGKRLSTIASVMRKIWILWSRWRRRGARTEQSMSKIYALQVSRKMMFYSIDLVLVTIFLRVLEGSGSKLNSTIPKIVFFQSRPWWWLMGIQPLHTASTALWFSQHHQHIYVCFGEKKSWKPAGVVSPAFIHFAKTSATKLCRRRSSGQSELALDRESTKKKSGERKQFSDEVGVSWGQFSTCPSRPFYFGDARAICNTFGVDYMDKTTGRLLAQNLGYGPMGTTWNFDKCCSSFVQNNHFEVYGTHHFQTHPYCCQPNLSRRTKNMGTDKTVSPDFGIKKKGFQRGETSIA